MMAEFDTPERSLLNSSPETVPETKDQSIYEVATTTPPDYVEQAYIKHSPRKRERLAFRLDYLADFLWEASKTLLQLKKRGEGWTAEICSYVFAVLSFLGLLATLFAHQNRPLPEWPQLISINSIVSLFSLLIRSSIGLVLAEGISQSKWQWFRKARRLDEMERFDAASRGAWGSFMLLSYTILERVPCIAALGAVTMITSSLTGFLLQQLMVFEDCLQRDPNTSARISKTNDCQAAYQGDSAIVYDPYPPMIGAINSGLINSFLDIPDRISHGCLSGNCTFPSDNEASFSTVAIGNSCGNITSQIRRSRRDDNSTILDLPIRDDEMIELCLECDDPKVVIGTAAEVTTYYDSDTLATIYILVSTPSGWQGFNCSLFPTVNTYAVTIRNSILNETLLDSVLIPSNTFEGQHRNGSDSLKGDSQRLQYSHRVVSKQTLRNGIWAACNETEGPSVNATKIVVFDETNSTKPSTARYYPNDCVWSFSRAAAGGISTYFAELFDGERFYWDQNILQNSIQNPAYWQDYNSTNRLPPRKKGPLHLRQLYNDGEFSLDKTNDIMRNVSFAMTSIVRTHFTEGPEWDAKGDMWVSKTCIRIDWRWVSFPAVTIGLTGIFLVLVMIENRGAERERLWKSSVLATLFCEVDRGIEKSANIASKRAMYDMAKSSSVRLEGEGGTLRLVAK